MPSTFIGNFPYTDVIAEHRILYPHAFAAIMEVTEVERRRIKKKMKNPAAPLQNETYTETLKQFITLLKSSLEFPVTNHPVRQLYGNYIVSLQESDNPIR